MHGWTLTLPCVNFCVCAINSKGSEASPARVRRWGFSVFTRLAAVYQSCHLCVCTVFIPGTFPGEIQVHVFEGHHDDVRGLENHALHDVLLPGGYAGLRALSVGRVQHQVTLKEGRSIKPD